MGTKWTKSSERPVDVGSEARATMPLSPRRAAFVLEYLKDFNALRAAKAVGYTGDVAGYMQLRRAEVRRAIATALNEKVMTVEEILARLSEQARAEYAEYLNPNGTVDLERLLADGKGHLIKGFRPTPSGLRVEFYDAQAALALIGKHLGLFSERLNMHHSGEVRFSADDAAKAERELDEWSQSRISELSG